MSVNNSISISFMPWFNYFRTMEPFNLVFYIGIYNSESASVSNQVYTVLLVLLLAAIYLKWPLNIVRDFSNRNHDTGKLCNRPNTFIYPNGWIPVIESSLLKFNTVQRIDFCNQRIVILRSSNGKPFALDAFCPHLGADFSVGGKMVRHGDHDCVRCPFHGWIFRAEDGLCLEVPYAKDKKPPPGVKVKVWKCLELNGFIYVWHHTEGIEPNWFPPRIDEIEDNKWTYRGRTEHIVSCLIQEVPENGADFAHLQQIHAPSFLRGKNFTPSGRNFLIDCVHHDWHNSWRKCDPPDQHKACFSLKNVTTLFGFKIVQLDFQQAEQIGPAIVNLKFVMKVAGYLQFEGAYVQGLTSLEPYKQKIVHLLYMKNQWFSRLAAIFLLYGEAYMVERDILIWSNKIYLDNPKLVKEEKQIVTFRRWYKQFFSKPVKLNSLDSW